MCQIQKTNMSEISISSRYMYHGKVGEKVPDKVTYITVHESVTRIEKRAFYQCRSLREIKFSESLKSIDEEAFKGCTSLIFTKFPKFLENIGSKAFQGCASLTSVDFTESSSLKIISNQTFDGCKSLNSANIPNSVTHIGHGAFCGCSSMKSVILPDSLKIIAKYTFSDCVYLTDINFPQLLESIDREAFIGCRSLVYIDFPTTLKRIGNRAFAICTSVIAVNFPESLEFVGSAAFVYCTSLLTTHCSSPRLEDVCTNIFNGCTSLVQVTFSESCQSIHEITFDNCRTLQLRQQPNNQDEESTLTWHSQRYPSLHRQQEKESIATWLKRQFIHLPVHDLCRNQNITFDLLNAVISTKSNSIHETDDLGMTALHILCLNPNATPDMLKLVANTYPLATTMTIEMVTNVEYDEDGKSVDAQHSMLTPVKLWLMFKGISYNDDDFNNEGQMKLVKALELGVGWNNLPFMMHIQSSFPDDNDVGNDNLYPFMKAATIADVNLETVYHLAMCSSNLIRQYSVGGENSSKEESTKLLSTAEDVRYRYSIPPSYMYMQVILQIGLILWNFRPTFG